MLRHASATWLVIGLVIAIGLGIMLEYALARFLRLSTSDAPETNAVANRLSERRVERAGVDLLFFFSW